MARYWVGGSGNWNDTARWSTTSGGSSGASVPTSADDVYFDGASDTGAAFTVTVNVASVCKDLIIGDGVIVTALDQAMTLAGSSALTVHGSWFNPATNYTRTYTGSVTFAATTTGNTITTNGVNFSNTLFDGVGGEWSLGSAFNMVGLNIINLNEGTFNTANYNVLSYRFISTTNNPCVINLGSSVLSFTITNATGFAIGNARASLTFNSGTSEIRLIGPDNVSGRGIGGTGNIYYKVVFGSFPGPIPEITGNTYTELDVGFNTVTIGSNTITDLVLAAPSSSIIRTAFFSNDVTISGTLTIMSGNTDPTRRYNIFSSITGTARTLTCAAIDIGDGVDFRDITIAGAASPFDASAQSTGDCGGNTDITFSAPKTVYWNLSGSQNWSATGWATTSTGTPAAANFPLAQDTAVITEAGSAGTIVMNAAWNIGTLTFDDGVSPRTSVVSLTGSSAPTIYKDLKLSSGVIMGFTGGVIFAGTETSNITSAGKSFSTLFQFLKTNPAAVVLQDNLISTSGSTVLGTGVLNLNGKVLRCVSFSSDNANVRSINFSNNGKIELSGDSGNIAVLTNVTNLSFIGTSRFDSISTAAAGSRRFASAATGFVEANHMINVFVTGGSNTFTLVSNFGDINLTGFSGTIGIEGVPPIYGNLTIPSTLVGFSGGTQLQMAKTSGIQTITGSNKTLVNINKVNSGILRMLDSFSMATFTLTGGVIDLNGNILTCTTAFLPGSGSVARELRFGSGQLVLSGTGTVFNYSGGNLLVTPNTGKIVLSDNSNTARTFAGNGVLTYPELEIGGATGTSTTTITGANGFAKLTSSKTVGYTIVFPNATTQVANWNINGSDSNLVTLSRTGASGAFTIQYTGPGYGVGRYLSISNSTVTTAGTMYALNSTDGGGNTNWVFDGPKKAQFLTFFDI